MTIDEFVERFELQYPQLHVGGLYNPEIICEDARGVEFRCYYDNYDNEDDSWTWNYNKLTGEFWN